VKLIQISTPSLISSTAFVELQEFKFLTKLQQYTYIIIKYNNSMWSLRVMVTVLLEILDNCWQNYILYYVTLYYVILITPYLIVSFCRFLNCIMPDEER